jgi:ribosome-binding protein aMBF1 (putative translation factor)
MSEPRESISPVEGTTDTVTLRRADFDALLTDLEDAEDRAAMLELALARAKRTVPEPLTIEEASRLLDGEHPIKVWREKRGWTQRALAARADISSSLLAEIEGGTKRGSVETLRKLAHELKVDLDTLVP